MVNAATMNWPQRDGEMTERTQRTLLNVGAFCLAGEHARRLHRKISLISRGLFAVHHFDHQASFLDVLDPRLFSDSSRFTADDSALQPYASCSRGDRVLNHRGAKLWPS